MNGTPRLGVLPVYHGNGHPTGANATFIEEHQLGLAAPPRPFALCIDCTDLGEQPGDTTAAVIAYGLEYLNETLVYLRDPHTGQRSAGLFPSAEDARAHYSQFGTLRLVYL